VRALGEFLERFCLPLVRGGDVAIGRPIDRRELEAMWARLPHEGAAQLAVDEARTAAIADLVVRPPPLVLDEEELSMAAAVHNLLFLVHPDADAWTVSRAARQRVVEAARAMAQVSVSERRERVLGRHGLLHNLFALVRRDVRVSWWTGSASYRGQRPPGRLAAWPQLRRVHAEAAVVGYDELFGSSELGGVVASLLRRSPLTQLLGMAREGPPLLWDDAAFVLRDGELGRAVAYRSIAGVDAKAQVAAPARMTAAFEQMLERTPAAVDVRAVAAFLVHLNALFALAEAAERDGGRSPLIATVLAPERAGQRPRGLASFFALPAALAEVDPRLAAPPGLDDDRALAERWRQHRAQVAEVVGEAVIAGLVVRLRRHLGARPAMLGSAEPDG
jgi:hypothetical protein